ncbi:hypothetical protein N0V88_002751 [Collariella sp. IMI 366227]|nr:hypothetical protein N0V88_002751 [Collariella sp. IMI 366227]
MSATPNFQPVDLEGTQTKTSDAVPSQHADNGAVRVEVQKNIDKNKKRKFTKRSGGGRKKKASGFEEFYCDPPMTPAEHKEEKDVLYPSHRPFNDRIEECIQRYRARRRLDPEREQLFSRYLMLGGIDSTVRQFQSTAKIGNDVLKDASKAILREMTADDVIQRGGADNNNPRFYNPNYPEHWDVDFTAVAAGFVSEHLPKMVGYRIDDFQLGVEVVLNFLKYVDRHEVCPEYADDLKNAQAVCYKALEETSATVKLMELLPGAFNASLSILYCATAKNEPEELETGPVWESSFPITDTKPDPKLAKLTSAATLTILYSPERYPPTTTWSIISTTELTYEVLSITLPTPAITAKYTAINSHLTNTADIQPCGTITTCPVLICDGWDNSTNATIPSHLNKETEFVLEEEMLKLLEVGMKLPMTVCTLNNGLQFIKGVKEVRPTYYVFLPQELMFRYKEPVLTDRPAPSIYGRGGEEDDDAGNE